MPEKRPYYVGKVWGRRGGYWMASRNIDYLSCEMLATPPIQIVVAHSQKEAIKLAKED